MPTGQELFDAEIAKIKLKIKEYSKCRVDDKNFICYKKKNINKTHFFLTV